MGRVTADRLRDSYERWQHNKPEPLPAPPRQRRARRKMNRAKPPGESVPGVEHGRLSSYTNHGCRCAECRQAAAEHRREWRAGRLTQGLADGTLEHGKQSTYNVGCRCDDCTTAHTENEWQRRERRKERGEYPW